MKPEPEENSDLLAGKPRVETSGNARRDSVAYDPPDGGAKAYAVMVGSFLTNGLLFGVINSYSVIYPIFKKNLDRDGISNAESRAALVGSLTVGTTFLLSPVSGVLSELLGLRLTAVLGGSIAATGLLLSSFLTHNIDALLFTYGIMYGLGCSLAYTPSLAILGHYFKKYLGIVNGIVTIGSSVFTIFMPLLIEHLIEKLKLEGMFRFLAGLSFCVALCGLLFAPPTRPRKISRQRSSVKDFTYKIINTDIWKNRRYRIWALSMPVALFGYFVPYVHIKQYMEDSFVNVNFNLPLQCIAITSCFGRLLFGFLSDRPGINKVLLQQISFYVIGSLTIILPFVKVFWVLCIVASGMGIFDGAFIVMIGPIAFELCGNALAAHAIGCMLGLAALPLSIGPAIAGHIYSINQSYTLPFVLAGISPLVGSTLMFFIRCRDTNRGANGNGHITAMPSPDIEKSPRLLASKDNKHLQLATL